MKKSEHSLRDFSTPSSKVTYASWELRKEKGDRKAIQRKMTENSPKFDERCECINPKCSMNFK